MLFLGTFAFRFSSQGGIAIDYVLDGAIKKTLWLTDSDSFLQKLYDGQRDGLSSNTLSMFLKV